MNARTGLIAAAVVVVTAALIGGWLTADRWRDWFAPAAETPDDHPHPHAERVKLSPQARANLKLTVAPIQLQTYARTIVVPGTIIDRPGKTDRGVSAPISGIVTQIIAVPGDTVRAGDELFALRVVSESLQTSQTDLFKTTRELQIAQEQKQRLEKAGEAVAGPRILELEYQLRRLATTAQALRSDLGARGLTPEQIAQIAEGKFVTTITIRAPSKGPGGGVLVSSVGAGAADDPSQVFEIQELKVHLGEQVQVGQTLSVLGQHQQVFVEGNAFASEIPLIERAAQQGWPITLEPGPEDGHWPALTGALKVQFLASRVADGSQTVPFFVPLTNQYRELSESGKVRWLYRFRTGQRVRLAVPVEQFPNVFVLPAAAVVREGADAYVFRANGDLFDRKAVQVVFEDRRNVVVANDGSINDGNAIAQNAAAALNRVLKAQAGGDEGGGHHGHSHDH